MSAEMTTTTPVVEVVSVEAVPKCLQELDQWGLWKRERGTKVPYSINGRRASSTDPLTWTCFDDALAELRRTPQAWAGLAWFFSGADPFVGIDLDDCLDESGNVKQWAREIVERFSDTYMEISPSGRGIKMWVRGSLPSSVGKVAVSEGGGGIEMYSHSRFFAVTGRAFRGKCDVEDHAKDVLELHASLTGNRGKWKSGPDVDGRIPYGSQHNTLISLAGTLAARGVCVEAIDDCLQTVNARQCERPGARGNISRIARSASPWVEPVAGAAGHGDGWREGLIVNREGAPKPLLVNAVRALRTAPEWAGVLGFNEFAVKTVSLKPAPWDGAAAGDWTDDDDTRAATWLQGQGIYVPVDVVAKAVQSVAKDSRFHPVKSYLDSLKWDGTKRVEGWLNLYLGVYPTTYSKAVGARWLIQAVARIYKPGCKGDSCLILEGEQGLGKSTALRTLGWPWFTDEVSDLGSKDSALQAQGTWVVELSELDALSRGEVSQVKAFLSRSVDRFRPPYGRHVSAFPRQCVFAGSVNDATYLRDATGGRRFWPVACTIARINELKRDRNQIWAEAVHLYRKGEVWWLDTKELVALAAAEQADRYDKDIWDSLIDPWLQGPTRLENDGYNPARESFSSTSKSVCVQDIMAHCIGKRQDLWSQIDKNRVVRCLLARGWERFRAQKNGKREWRYQPKDE